MASRLTRRSSRAYVGVNSISSSARGRASQRLEAGHDLLGGTGDRAGGHGAGGRHVGVLSAASGGSEAAAGRCASRSGAAGWGRPANRPAPRSAGEHGGRHDRVRGVEHRRRLEGAAVDLDRLQRAAHVEVVLGANGRPRMPASCALKSLDPSSRISGDDVASGVATKRFQSPSSVRASPSRPMTSMRWRGKSSAPRLSGSAQGGGGVQVRTRRPADAEVDAAGVQRLQQRELLGHHQRGVVGQHHPARAHPDAGRDGRQVRDQHRWRAGHRRHVVVLRHPEAPVAEPSARRASVVVSATAAALVEPLRDGRQVEHRRGGASGCRSPPRLSFPRRPPAGPAGPLDPRRATW